MSPKYKLTYFDAMGIAEPARLLFAYAGVEYEDVRVAPADWPNLKPQTPWGVLPVLEEDGQQLAQSGTIVRYLGRKFGLAGEDEFETAKCDEFVDVIFDLRLEAMAFMKEQDAAKKIELGKKLQEESIPRVYKKFENILKKNGSGFLVGKNLTFADFFFAHFIQFFRKHAGVTDELMEGLPAINAHQLKIVNLPGIREWLDKRPATLF